MIDGMGCGFFCSIDMLLFSFAMCSSFSYYLLCTEVQAQAGACFFLYFFTPLRILIMV